MAYTLILHYSYYIHHRPITKPSYYIYTHATRLYNTLNIILIKQCVRLLLLFSDDAQISDSSPLYSNNSLLIYFFIVYSLLASNKSVLFLASS